jgi:hypothetical protein
MSRLSKRLLRRASKAPCISIVTIVIILLLLIASSILCTKAATKSMAALFGRAPPCCGLSNPEVSAVQRQEVCISHVVKIYNKIRHALPVQEPL